MGKRVVMIEDHTLIRQVLTSVVTERLGCELAGACGGLESGIAACRELRPHLVILDWVLPDGTGALLLDALRNDLPDTRWLAMSAHENAATVRLAIAQGAHGFVMKQSSLDCFATAIRRLLAGDTWFCPIASRLLATAGLAERVPELTPRERQILSLYARGRNAKAIAVELGVSAKTVQNQFTTLREKLGLYEPADLIRCAVERGLT